MRISKLLWVEDGVKWTAWKRNELIKRNKYRGNVYIVCSSPCKNWLFEIVESRHLSHRYEDCYVLGIMHTRESATQYILSLIDAIYNKQIMSYEALFT